MRINVTTVPTWLNQVIDITVPSSRLRDTWDDTWIRILKWTGEFGQRNPSRDWKVWDRKRIRQLKMWQINEKQTNCKIINKCANGESWTDVEPVPADQRHGKRSHSWSADRNRSHDRSRIPHAELHLRSLAIRTFSVRIDEKFVQSLIWSCSLFSLWLEKFCVSFEFVWSQRWKFPWQNFFGSFEDETDRKCDNIVYLAIQSAQTRIIYSMKFTRFYLFLIFSWDFEFWISVSILRFVEKWVWINRVNNCRNWCIK